MTTKELIHRLGRPPKYTSDMPVTLIDCMRQGMSVVEVCCELGIAEDTFYDWSDPVSPRFNEAFSEAIKIGNQFYRAWWVSQGKLGLRDREFNTALWIFNAKNRIGYRDTVDVTSGGMPIQFSNQIPRPTLAETVPNTTQAIASSVAQPKPT